VSGPAATSPDIPCARCGEVEDSTLHRTAEECGPECKAPQDHHAYRPDPDSLQARYKAVSELASDLAAALVFWRGAPQWTVAAGKALTKARKLGVWK
jgi:hypothetical protein